MVQIQISVSFLFLVWRSKSISFGNSVSLEVVQPDSQNKNGFLLQNLLPGTHLFCVYGDNWFQSVRYSCNTLTFAAPSLLGTLSGAWWRFRRTPTALQRSRPQRRNWQTRKRSLKFSRCCMCDLTKATKKILGYFHSITSPLFSLNSVR